MDKYWRGYNGLPLEKQPQKKKIQSPACSKFISSSLKVWVITFRLHVAVIFTPRPRLFVTLPLKSYIDRIPFK